MKSRQVPFFLYWRVENLQFWTNSIGHLGWLSRISNFPRFHKNVNSLEPWKYISENSSPKGSFWRNKRKSEFSFLSWDSRYLWAVALNANEKKQTIKSKGLLCWLVCTKWMNVWECMRELVFFLYPTHSVCVWCHLHGYTNLHELFQWDCCPAEVWLQAASRFLSFPKKLVGKNAKQVSVRASLWKWRARVKSPCHEPIDCRPTPALPATHDRSNVARTSRTQPWVMLLRLLFLRFPHGRDCSQPRWCDNKNETWALIHALHMAKAPKISID